MQMLLRIVVWALAVPTSLAAQGGGPDVAGTWEAETPDGPRQVVVRPDSSASFGDETVRWRVVADTLFIAFGEEWVGYHVARKGRTLTFSGGDLEEPISLKWVGPPTPLPDGATVPTAPPFKPEVTG